MSVEVKKVKSNLDEILNKVDYSALSGRGGAFLVTPLNKFKIFTRELLNEDQKNVC